MVLRGKKVVLREKRISDAPRDYAWRSDKELARLDATQPLQISFPQFMVDYRKELKEQGRWQHQFAIESLDGEHIGNCSYYNLDEERKEAELGILIGNREYWGKGYGTDAVTTLVRYLFQEKGLKRVYLHTLEWNIRARKCFENCGFVACSRINSWGNRFIVMELHRDWLKEI